MKVSDPRLLIGLFCLICLGGPLLPAQDRPAPGSVPVPSQNDENPENLTPEMPELPDDPEIRGRTAYLRLWFIPKEGTVPLSVFLLPSTGSQFHTLANELEGTLLANYRDVPAGRQTVLICPTEFLLQFEETITAPDLKRLADSNPQQVSTLDVQLSGSSFQTVLLSPDGVNVIHDSNIPLGEKRIRTINFANGLSPEIRLRKGRQYSSLFSNITNQLQEEKLPANSRHVGLQMACQVTPDFEAQLNMEVSLHGVRSCTAVIFRNRYNQLDFLVTRDAREF